MSSQTDKTMIRVSAVESDLSFRIRRCCELPTPIPSRRPGLNLTISCNNCGAMLLHMDMETGDGLCHRQIIVGVCRLPDGHPGYCSRIPQ